MPWKNGLKNRSTMAGDKPRPPPAPLPLRRAKVGISGRAKMASSFCNRAARENTPTCTLSRRVPIGEINEGMRS